MKYVCGIGNRAFAPCSVAYRDNEWTTRHHRSRSRRRRGICHTSIYKTYRPTHAAEPNKRKGRSFLFVFIRSLLTAVAITAIFNIMFGIAIVSGASMEPALHEGDVIIFWKLTGSYERGEIVLIKTDGRKDYVKRVCALPGETLAIDDGSGAFLINGKVQYEPYIYEKTHDKPEVNYPLSLSPGEYFVMGDHRSDSRDSRNYGAVTEEQIDGKAIIIIRKGF